jgi:hypothetical protein
MKILTEILSSIPGLVKKFIGYSCSLFMLGWGGYDYFEGKLNANNDKLKNEMRIERKAELAPINTQMSVIQNDVGWLKNGVGSANDKLDKLILRMK